MPSVASVLEAGVPKAVVVELGEETVEEFARTTATSISSVRKLRVRVIAVAKTQQDLAQLCDEVEAAAPYSTQIQAMYAGTEQASDGSGESFRFSSRVNFDVLYEVTTIVA